MTPRWTLQFIVSWHEVKNNFVDALLLSSDSFFISKSAMFFSMRLCRNTILRLCTVCARWWCQMSMFFLCFVLALSDITRKAFWLCMQNDKHLLQLFACSSLMIFCNQKVSCKAFLAAKNSSSHVLNATIDFWLEAHDTKASEDVWTVSAVERQSVDEARSMSEHVMSVN